ncbi:MAG: hypothetical protein LJD31_05085, partial [Wolbachia endosymbiont of Menacanthus eurysternus]|nr:hypothetical protein [Wolbachia endosymbiont of Menacanthus eurysternus]
GTWMTPITLLFQRVTLESRNFIRLVGIKVMLKCTIFMENWIPVSEHWDDKKRKHWDDRRRDTGMTKKVTWMTS